MVLLVIIYKVEVLCRTNSQIGLLLCYDPKPNHSALSTLRRGANEPDNLRDFQRDTINWFLSSSNS